MLSRIYDLLYSMTDNDGRLHIALDLRQDETVLELKDRIARQERDIERLQKDMNRTEYLFRCECSLNNRLIDLCRENGVIFEAGFFDREQET